VFLQSYTQANSQNNPIQTQFIVNNYISIGTSGQTIETRFILPKTLVELR